MPATSGVCRAANGVVRRQDPSACLVALPPPTETPKCYSAAVLDRLLAWDGALRNWLTAYHAPPLDWLMAALSFVGRSGAIWLFLGFVLMLRRRSRARGVLQLVLAIVVTSTVVNVLVKPAVGRPRPFLAEPDTRLIGEPPANSSFPSGHAANAAAGAYALTRLVPRLGPLYWTLAGLIGLSRILVGVHYPLDVAAGWLVGYLCAVLVIGGTRWEDEPRGT